MKVVFPDDMGLTQTSVENFRSQGVEVYTDTPTDQNTIVDRIKDAEIITACYIDITKEIIDQLPKLKYIISPAVGFEWIDYNYAAEKDIQVLNCPTFNSQAVAELAVGLLFAIARRIPEANNSLVKGEWKPLGFLGTELRGKKLGLVGHGNIGRRIEAMAKSIGMQVDHVDSKSTESDFDGLLKASDVICICAQLNETTRGMIGAEELDAMKEDAYLVNVSRGAILDEGALIDCMKRGKFAGVGLDVFQNEPFGESATDAIKEIVQLPRVVATPHMGYNTQDAVEKLAEEVQACIDSCIVGQPINVVND